MPGDSGLTSTPAQPAPSSPVPSRRRIPAQHFSRGPGAGRGRQCTASTLVQTRVAHASVWSLHPGAHLGIPPGPPPEDSEPPRPDPPSPLPFHIWDLKLPASSSPCLEHRRLPYSPVLINKPGVERQDEDPKAAPGFPLSREEPSLRESSSVACPG